MAKKQTSKKPMIFKPVMPKIDNNMRKVLNGMSPKETRCIVCGQPITFFAGNMEKYRMELKTRTHAECANKL